MLNSFADLSSLLALLVALSAASQRLVDIVKGFNPSLGTERTDATEEAKRKLVVQGIAIGAGIVTALLAMWAGVFTTDWNAIGKVLVLGLMASGGSSFWSSMLGYVNGIKDIKQTQAVDADVKVKANVAQVAKEKAAQDAAATRAKQGVALQELEEVKQPHYLVQAQDNLEQAIESANSRLKRN